MNKVRCAIYTRKSSDEGLDQSFNSLDAQREACEAYIRSQKHEGWKVVSTRYDDGGASGGNMDRAALQSLLLDIEAGRIDMIVVYKIDRLTRSFSDFAKLVDRLDGAGASFVSVTQQFNTSTSMGRLTLNVLLSFAQFEREVTAERIRDKIAASKKKGLWMGGLVPLGYDKGADGLIINSDEADTVRALFNAYLNLKDVSRLKAWADQKGLRSKSRTLRSGEQVSGKPFTRGHLYKVLSNPIYIGKISHKGELYEGVHQAILTQEGWDQVQALRASQTQKRKSSRNYADNSALAGKLFDDQDRRFHAAHAQKQGKRYRYYIQAETKQRLPAVALENAVRKSLFESKALQSVEGLHDTADLISLVERVTITVNQVTLQLVPNLKLEEIVVPYTLRRRGFETRIVLGGVLANDLDKILIQRVLQAMDWLKEIKSGKSLTEVAKANDLPVEYVSANLDLALLSPKVLSAISKGQHDPYFTATRLKKMKLPLKWSDQETLLIL